MQNKQTIIDRKDKTVAILLAFFLGGFGAHRFYLGRTVDGAIRLVFFWTFIPAAIAVIDIIIMLTTSETRWNQQYNGQ